MPNKLTPKLPSKPSVATTAIIKWNITLRHPNGPWTKGKQKQKTHTHLKILGCLLLSAMFYVFSHTKSHPQIIVNFMDSIKLGSISLITIGFKHWSFAVTTRPT